MNVSSTVKENYLRIAGFNSSCLLWDGVQLHVLYKPSHYYGHQRDRILCPLFRADNPYMCSKILELSLSHFFLVLSNKATILDKSPWDNTAMFLFFCYFLVPS